MLAFKHAPRIGASPEPDPGTAPIRTTPLPSYGRAIDPQNRPPEEDSMQAHAIGRPRMPSPARTAARWAAVLAAVAALAACGTPRVAAATPGGYAPGQKTVTYYAFDINNGAADSGFIPAPGTNPKVFAQGDELIINDQLTTTHQVNGGYPIVGHDAGVCTLTRIPQQHVPQKHANQTLANCVVTAVWDNGSLTVQGVIRFKSQQPEPALFAVTGGTGRFDGAAGTLEVSFTKNFKILTINIK
jgi:hypothetical protein